MGVPEPYGFGGRRSHDALGLSGGARRVEHPLSLNLVDGIGQDVSRRTSSTDSPPVGTAVDQ